MKKLIGIYSFLAIVFFACDDPDCPYLDERLCDPEYRDSIEGAGGGDIDTTGTDTGTVSGNLVCYSPSVFDQYERTVLLEDFTGFRCTNCLPATQTASAQEEQWNGRLIVVAYHVMTQFAAPSGTPPEPFSTDLRTDAGEQLSVEYQLTSLPNGLVCRREFSGSAVQPAGSWPDRINQLMTEDVEGFIRFRDVELSSDSSEVSFRVAARALTEVEENWNLVIGIYENGIIEAQKNGQETIFPYTHNHVFRGGVNGTYGETIITPTSEWDDNCAELYEYTMTLDPVWVPENCYLFAYLMKESSLEVVQCTKVHL